MTPEELSGIERLGGEDIHVRDLARIIRDGPGTSLDDAIAEAKELGRDATRVDAAAVKIRQLQLDIVQAQIPRAVIAGGIESWYIGSRENEDRNWPALRTLLEEDGWSAAALGDLGHTADKVVANLPNPHGENYRCRGLVLGYVQSGKTTNFTAVIAKAADAGYRFFIVLSGIHNALRWQTQDRLNAQLRAPNSHLWHALTDEHDFQKSTSLSVDALLSTADQRVLAVVKKNGPRLKALKDWLFAARPELLARCPVLIIDDEADQASVNTAKPDRSPTRINRLIREIAEGLPKSAYVGYTATPFANVLIDPTDQNDLYPRDFIVDIPRPDIYIGPEAIFGRESLEFDADSDPEDDGHDFVRSVPSIEITALRPQGAKTRHDFDPEITDSLDRALRYFLLSTAARRIRAKGNPHATALVHTSQHIDVHTRTARAISEHLRRLAGQLAERDTVSLAAFEEIWAEECERVPAADWGEEAVAWDDVSRKLATIAADAVVITDNSQSHERLRFDDADPRVIVAVGGNTLSRGLTLEGLAVSFFVRTASAYDTLLQMGRWFGYRKGYADLTRIWMTDEMRGWFHHLATVEQEIRYEIDRYDAGNDTPETLGTRIRTHPKLAITAAAKMQHARRADASYSGRRLQTILFNHTDRDWLAANVDTGRRLVERLTDAPRVAVRDGITAIGPVPTPEIVRFMADYRFHEESRDLDSDLITRYLRGRLTENELTHFRLMIMGRATTDEHLGAIDLGLGEPTACINRSRLDRVGGTYADIKTLMSRHDRVIDLGLNAGDVAKASIGELSRMRNLPTRGGRGDDTGLLLLYPVSKDSVPARGNARTRRPLDAIDHVLGIGLVFPESASRTAQVDYVTADVASMHVDVEAPDEADDLVESPEDAE